MDFDPYALNKESYIPLRVLYESRIVPNNTLMELINKADRSIDLVNSSIAGERTDIGRAEYGAAFRNQEMVGIPQEIAYRIIDNILGAFDGYTSSTISPKGPDFRLQLSTNPTIRCDSVGDGASRVNGIDRPSDL